MNEIIDIVTELGEPTGTTALKSEAHKNGWFHNTVHLWLYTNAGEILLQQRSHLKQIHPLLWDVSVAGHIDAGETFEEAALREAKEEIGIDLKESQLIHIGAELHKGEYNNGAIKDYEFHQMFIAEFDTPLASLVVNAEEVEAIKLVSIVEFEALLEGSGNNSHFIPTNKPYYQFIIGQIQKRLI